MPQVIQLIGNLLFSVLLLAFPCLALAGWLLADQPLVVNPNPPYVYVDYVECVHCGYDEYDMLARRCLMCGYIGHGRFG